ncbi:hypothetical protein A8A54_13360 [Brucella pseudogrignonensis]|uniref:hypothetical protein n=1 Tax=Brucella pseudogrignonensis TaxID=419475 RepID=UPI0007DA5E01|nr:hypothetical protein [Brucella pseudogrignonensis]ANG97372.1 hypothetical protein A8A54_13360 [Brucella pseudogrignonensis]
MIRSVLLLIVGVGALVQGILRLGKPAQAVERTGWLYQQFGDQGVAYGTMAIGLVALVVGVIMFNNTWVRAIRERRKS